MGFHVTDCVETNADPRSKNRVGVSRHFRADRARRFPSQPTETTSETSVTVTITVSGLPFWLSRDPIGENGGANLYRMVSNSTVSKSDYLGLFDKPNNLPARLHNRAKWWMPDAMVRAMGALVVGRIQDWMGDDPWITRFMEHYFFDSGETVTLTDSEVRSLNTAPAIIDFHMESPTFFTPGTVSHTKSYQLFSIASLGEGNLTLGEFHLAYEGEVDAQCTFKGKFTISDRFDFNWRKWGERSIRGELRLRIFTLLTSGIPFDVDSEEIDVEQKRTDGTARW